MLLHASSYLAIVAIASTFVSARLDGRASHLASTMKSSAVAVPTEPCAQVSHHLASFTSAYPSATQALQLPASLAYECASSAPIVKEDALRLVEGLEAFFQWQSDLSYLADPPDGYLLDGVGILAGLKMLRTDVQAGEFPNEIYFEEALSSLLGRTHDGHLQFVTDCMGVFTYSRDSLGSLVSISADSYQTPQIWSLRDLYYARLYEINWTPSPLVTINGLPASDFITNYATNTTIRFQDPDALYNSVFYQISNADGDDGTTGYFYSPFPNFYIGASTNVTYANGTSQSYINDAITQLDFTGVVDGKSFYNKFCNAKRKPDAAGGGSRSRRRAAGATNANIDYPRGYYPPAVIESKDGSLAGYFLNETGFQNVAILSILGVTETAEQSAQATLSKFIELCQKHGRDHLIIDMSSNGGGSILLGYDIFKQLFPNIVPFGAANLRATEEFNIIGSQAINLADEAEEQSPGNLTVYDYVGVDDIFDGDAFLNQYGERFQDWRQYFGPETRYKDSFTHLVRWNISNSLFDHIWSEPSAIVVSHANNLPSTPPFQPENVILFTDGQCSSTCATISHFLKWQGKVKSIVAGGRPQTGPAQAIGGVKGKNVYGLPGLMQKLQVFYDNASPSAIKRANATSLKTLYELADYLVLRLANPHEASSLASLNIQNSIAEGDASFTPLQFVYEAADCRVWWTEDMIFRAPAIWTTVAEQAWGMNDTQPWAKCLPGSIGHPSCLSGNPALYNDGVPTNVTDFAPEPGVKPPPSATTST